MHLQTDMFNQYAGQPSASAVSSAVPAPEERCSIELLRLPQRVLQALQRGRVATVGQLRRLDAEALGRLAGMPAQAVEATLATAHAFQLTDDDPLSAIAISELRLSVRTTNALLGANILTVKALLGLSEGRLAAVKGLGRGGLDEIHATLPRFQTDALERREMAADVWPAWADHPVWRRLVTPWLNLPKALDAAVQPYATIATLIAALQEGLMPLDGPQVMALEQALRPYYALKAAPVGFLTWLDGLGDPTVRTLVGKHGWTPSTVAALAPWQILAEIPPHERALTQAAIEGGQLPFRRFSSVDEELEMALSVLTERERQVIIGRFGLYSGEGLTLEAVGRSMNVVRERVRQLEQKAKRKLSAHGEALMGQTRALAKSSLRAQGGLATPTAWAEAVGGSLPAQAVSLPAVLDWLSESLDGVQALTLRETPVFVGAPLSVADLEAVRAELDAFWAEHHYGTWEQLLQAIAPALPDPALLDTPAVTALLQALCLEPQPGVFARDRWSRLDHVRHILHEAGVPLHYEVITERLQARLPLWSVENPEAAVQAYLLREGSGIIRTGQGIYALAAWGGMRFSHFREVLLDHLCRQELPQHVDAIVEALSGTYAIQPQSFRWTLDDHPNLFQRFGRAPIYGVAGRRYELSDDTLLRALVAALEAGPRSLAELSALPALAAYDSSSIELYLCVSPLFWVTGSSRRARYALSVAGKRRYDLGDSHAVVAEVFELLAEPLHSRDVWRFVRESFAYPPGEEAFRRVMLGGEYVPVGDQFVVPRAWLVDPAVSARFEDLDQALFQRIALVSLNQAPRPDDATLFDWLSYCYLNHCFYRGALIFEQLDMQNLPESRRGLALQIGRICQRNGDLSLLDPEHEGNQDQRDLAMRLDLNALRREAQGCRRQPSKGLAGLPDGAYRVRYGEANLEVHLEKRGGQEAPVARVLGLFVGGRLFDAHRHAPLPGGQATPEDRTATLARLCETELTAYAQITPFLRVIIGPRRNWGLSYKSFTPVGQTITAA